MQNQKLKKGEVFITEAEVMLLKNGKDTMYMTGRNVGELRFEYYAKFDGQQYAWCKTYPIAGKFFVLIPVDARIKI